MKELLFATTNEDKAREAEEILGVSVKFANLEVDEIQSEDITKVAQEKAKAAYEKLKNPVIVDDVSLKIEAWYGLPGPMVKFFQKKGNDKFLEMIGNRPNRNVTVICAVAYHDGKNVEVFTGEFNGTLTTEERGTDGWGFDFIVIPEGETQTLAELGTDRKNQFSHRRRALDKLSKYLEQQK